MSATPAYPYDERPLVAHSSSGPGRRPLKAEIAGSNPACATTRLVLRPARRSGPCRSPAASRRSTDGPGGRAAGRFSADACRRCPTEWACRVSGQSGVTPGSSSIFKRTALAPGRRGTMADLPFTRCSWWMRGALNARGEIRVMAFGRLSERLARLVRGGSFRSGVRRMAVPRRARGSASTWCRTPPLAHRHC